MAQHICKECLPENLKRIAEEIESDNLITHGPFKDEAWSVGDDMAWHIVDIAECTECQARR